MNNILFLFFFLIKVASYLLSILLIEESSISAVQFKQFNFLNLSLSLYKEMGQNLLVLSIIFLVFFFSHYFTTFKHTKSFYLMFFFLLFPSILFRSKKITTETLNILNLHLNKEKLVLT